jgi:hypothetical protein
MTHEWKEPVYADMIDNGPMLDLYIDNAARTGRTLGLDLWQGDCALQCGCLLGDLGLGEASGPSTHRAGWTRPPQPFDPALCIFAVSAGRPRASPEPTVLLGDRAAVPCRPVTTLERGPTTHGTIRTSHRPSRATRGSFGPAPGWRGHHPQRSGSRTGHAPYG